MSDANGTPTTTTTTPPTETKPLWPNGLQIEVLGLTGEFASGKTLFALSISPGPSTLVFDCEKSSGTYASLGFDRVDLPSEMLAKHPGGYKPIDLFLHWREKIRKLPTGKYRVIVLDPVSEIETGLVEYVRKNPQDFGYTPGQFARAEALMWGAAKDLWKAVLSDLASRCECFAFTSHLRQVWKGNAPSGKKAPKGKETLMELASLYLELERKPDTKGNVPAVPAAKVLKSRLAATKINDAGEVVIVPILPPRLPMATPTAIRQYVLTPPDYDKLKKGELAPDDPVTEADLQAMKLETAREEAEAERLRNERLNRAANATTTTATPAVAATPATTAEPSPTTSASKTQSERDNGKPSDPADPFGNAPTNAMLSNLKAYKTQLGISDDQWKNVILAKRGVTSAKQLTQVQCEELVDALAKRLSEKERIRKEAENGQLVGAGSGN